jgi:hypothetical protein
MTPASGSLPAKPVLLGYQQGPFLESELRRALIQAPASDKLQLSEEGELNGCLGGSGGDASVDQKCLAGDVAA